MEIKAATLEDYPRVRDFYYSLIDAMEEAEYKPGWERDVYPTREFLLDSIENSQLFYMELEEGIAACMVVNNKYNDGYKKVRWSVEAADDELFVVHALGVHPAYGGRGFAKMMVKYVIDLARKNKIKTIRLDVLGGNVPAERAYTKMGFQYLETLKMFYEDTGWTDYMVYELVL